MRDGCAFCEYDGPNEVVKKWTVPIFDAYGNRHDYHYFVIEPLNPVTPGHLLVIPRVHVADFRVDPWLLAATMQAAAVVAADTAADEVVQEGRPPLPGCNLIVSAGAEATQTVPHVHVHVIPRREGDGLLLPWSAPDARQGFAAAIDLIDEHVGMDDETMNPIRAAYRQLGGK